MLDKNDIALLKKAKEDGQSLDEIIKGAERIVALNNLKRKIKDIGNIIFYKFNEILENNIEEIASLENEEKILDFVIKESYNLYKKEQEEREKEEQKRLEAEKKMRETEEEKTLKDNEEKQED